MAVAGDTGRKRAVGENAAWENGTGLREDLGIPAAASHR